MQSIASCQNEYPKSVHSLWKSKTIYLECIFWGSFHRPFHAFQWELSFFSHFGTDKNDPPRRKRNLPRGCQCCSQNRSGGISGREMPLGHRRAFGLWGEFIMEFVQKHYSVPLIAKWLFYLYLLVLQIIFFKYLRVILIEAMYKWKRELSVHLKGFISQFKFFFSSKHHFFVPPGQAWHSVNLFLLLFIHFFLLFAQCSIHIFYQKPVNLREEGLFCLKVYVQFWSHFLRFSLKFSQF